MMHVSAWDMDGRRVWEARPAAFYSKDGFCVSPVLWKDTIIVNGDQDGPCFLAALDRRTGRTVWKTARTGERRSYCTPIVRTLPTPMPPPPRRARNDPRAQLLLSGTHSVSSYDPDTGERHWFIRGPTKQFVASLVVHDDRVLMSGGFPERHIMAIDPAGRGDVTDTHVVWHRQRTRYAAYVPSPVVVNGFLLIASDFGDVSCFDAATGRVHWRERLARHYSASIVTANGLAYLTADHGLDGDPGVTTVVRVGRTLEVVSNNTIGEAVYASPAISDGQIFIRGETHLFCIGRR